MDKGALENVTLKIRLYATPTASGLWFFGLFFFWNAL